MPSALAIDLGTTAAKAAVVGSDGTILGSAVEPLTTVFGADGAATQDPEMVWQAVVSACATAVGLAGADAARDVRVVCPTSQWASIVPVGPDGHPVGDLVMWLDRRGEREVGQVLAAEGSFARWPEVNGFVPAASLAHVLWLQRHQPEIHARATAYLEPMDYLGARLSGRIAASANSAMPFTLTDNRNLANVAWSNELIERAGVDRSRLPELLPGQSVLGPLLSDVAGQLGVERDVVVAVGANDSIAAVLGTGAVEPGTATVVIGTTGVLTAHHPTRVVSIEQFVLTMPSALHDRYYVVAEAGLAGKVVETALEQWGLGTTYDEFMAAAATAAPGSGGVLFLPWLIGALAPAPNSRLRGAFLGLSLDTGRAELARAVLEGIGLQMRWLLDEVEAVLSTRFSMLRLAGGGAQSDTLAAIVADVLGRTVEQIADPRFANCRGAAALGLLATGDLDLAGAATFVRVNATYEPHDGALHTERVALYRELHESLAAPMRRLRRATPK